MKKVIHAAMFAAQKHKDQRRKDESASPYINHPLALAHILANECQILDEDVLSAALLHDTIEDTQTTEVEILEQFGARVLGIVKEVTDDKSLPKPVRKRLQIEHAAHLSYEAKLIKLADKICNLRDMAINPPADWSLSRRIEYYDWAKDVVEGLRGAHPPLEDLFDQAYKARPHN
jgi:guanosine-3',5'-bis(diphosphate) 3'-pyrophosphohydrolase